MWIYVFVGIIFFKGFLCQDPCTPGNNRLLDELNRSTNYSFGPNDPDLCDGRLLDEGWYRISENGHIATECPDMLRCGSMYPVWLNGTLPERGERGILSACQRGFMKCCEYTFTVEVQNCNYFYVFYLTTIPVCPGRYCIAMPMSFSVLPKVEAFIPTYNSASVYRQLAFRCQAVIPPDFHQYVFDITWYINNNEIVSNNQIPYSKLNTDGVLHRMYWDSHPNGPTVLGFWVMCKMRARHHKTSIPSSYTSSNAFYAGAQIERTSFTVKSGREVTIKIKSTVPVACVHIFGQNLCTVAIDLFSLKDHCQSRPANCNASLSDEEIQMSSSTCGLAFDGTQWQNYHTFKIKTLSDQAFRSSYKCAAKLIARSNIDTLWNNYQLPEIYIHVFNQDRPRGSCYSGHYPHMYTFDGGFLTTHGKGEFVLFRHRSKPIEVHVIQRLEEQNHRLGSNCAIMFRAATDMFVIYGCNSPTRWITRRLNCNSGQQYLQVSNRGQDYEVIMPTGTIIYVYVKTSWLKIQVHVSPSDWEQTEGLCGTYNGNLDDDFTNRNGTIVNKADFFFSWIVQGSQSLFIARSRTEQMMNAVLYCSCFNTSDILPWNHIEKEQADCTWKESLPMCRPMKWKDTTCRKSDRTKREITDDFDFDVPLDVVKYEMSRQNIEWKNGWNEQKAVNACASFFAKSKLFTLCSKLSRTYDIHRSTCVADIKISGSDVFLSSSLDSMKVSCMHEIRLNTTFWRPKTKLEITTDANCTLASKYS